MGILNWFGRDLDKVEGIVEKLPTTFFRDRTQELRLDPPQADVKAAYFVGCGFNFVLPEVSEATLDVLVGSGAAVRIADNCCCGLPAYGYGDLEAARSMAKINIEVLEKTKTDVVVTECGSCSAFLKDYPELFENDPAWQKRARELNKKVKGFSEFMLDRLPAAAAGAKASAKVTYHDPCHMSRYQKVVSQPRALLKKIPGVTYVELPEADRCCGAAGSYNVMHYEQSMRVLERKVENVKKTGAEILATECPGCIIQLRYGARQAGLKTRVAHISELVREANRS
jgi:glycolate oxidase iron-sulfur subunit